MSYWIRLELRQYTFGSSRIFSWHTISLVSVTCSADAFAKGVVFNYTCRYHIDGPFSAGLKSAVGLRGDSFPTLKVTIDIAGAVDLYWGVFDLCSVHLHTPMSD